jgi:hypothetical protein
MSDALKTSNGQRLHKMSAKEQARAVQLDLLAACTATAFKAAEERRVKRLGLSRRMLKQIDAWAMDHKMPRSDAIQELLARGLKVKPKTNGRINPAARAKEQRSAWIM